MRQSSRHLEQLADVTRVTPLTTELHTAETLSTRIFYDQPVRDIPHAGYVRAYTPDDPRRA